MYPGILTLDANRHRFSTRDWKSLAALKLLSSHLRDLLASSFRDPTRFRVLSGNQRVWFEVWEGVLGAFSRRL